VQQSLNRAVVRFVPAQDYTPAAGESIRNALKARMGPITVDLEPMEQIPRAANGKFRAVVCEIPATERPIATHDRDPSRAAMASK
jgi:phenylacetate-CoA ligase